MFTGNNITPTSRCGQFYRFGSQADNTTKAVLTEMFPNKTLDQIYEPNWHMMEHTLPMNVFNGLVIAMIMMIFAVLVYSAWHYGYKEKHFQQSITLVTFYVIAAVTSVINLTMACLVIYLINITSWFIN